jgi:hypothetical protein
MARWLHQQLARRCRLTGALSNTCGGSSPWNTSTVKSSPPRPEHPVDWSCGSPPHQTETGDIPMATFLRRFHLIMVIVWLGLSVPGILLWKESILFVIILSLYANIAAEFSAYQGARAEQKNDEPIGNSSD